VLIASGTATFAAGGTQKVTIKLTGIGKQLLKRSRQLKITAKGAFTPAGKAPVTTIKGFSLKR